VSQHHRRDLFDFNTERNILRTAPYGIDPAIGAEYTPDCTELPNDFVPACQPRVKQACLRAHVQRRLEFLDIDYREAKYLISEGEDPPTSLKNLEAKKDRLLEQRKSHRHAENEGKVACPTITELNRFSGSTLG
jgi:hypothetical protein